MADTWKVFHDMLLEVGKAVEALSRRVRKLETGTLLDYTTGVFNVKAFGASPSKTSVENATAFQAALDAVEASGSGKLIIPNGVYSVNSGLSLASVDHVIIEGEGTAMIVGDASSGDILTVTGCQDIVINNLWLTGSGGTNAGHGLYINNSYSIKLNKVWITECQYHQFYTNNSFIIKTDYCYFNALSSDAGYAACYHGTNANDILHSHSRIYNSTTRPAVWIVDGRGISFISCDIEGSGDYGIIIDGGVNINVFASYLEAHQVYAIWIRGGENINIDNNVITLNDSNGEVGIYLNGGNGLSISKNSFYGGDPGVTSTAIKVEHNTTYGATPFLAQIRSDNYFISVTTLIDNTRSMAFEEPRFGRGGVEPLAGHWYSGDIQWNSQPSSTEYVGWVCTVSGMAIKEVWTTGNAYVIGDYVEVSGTGRIYVATSAGNAGVITPVHVAGIVSDGGVDWLYVNSVGPATFKGFGTIA